MTNSSKIITRAEAAANTDLVSVIIPTYKHSDFVLETLESVFAQTFTDYEIIVVNDGSPDDTTDVLRPLINSGRIKYIEQPNAGQAAARNRGLAEAKGEFIAFLDDDDLWPIGKLEWQTKILFNNSHAVMAFGYVTSFGSEEGRFPPPDAAIDGTTIEFLWCNWIRSPGASLIRADALRKMGGFNTAIWGSDDWDAYLQLSKLGRIIYRDEEALRYRFHRANASQNTWKMYLNSRKVFERHKTAGGNYREQRKILKSLRRHYSRQLSRLANALITEHRLLSAVVAKTRAFTLSPLFAAKDVLEQLGWITLKKRSCNK